MESVIEISVGGTLFETTLETLSGKKRFIDETFFSLWHNGKFGCLRNAKGILFFDKDPEIFALVLKWLRGYEVKSLSKDVLLRLKEDAGFFLLDDLYSECAIQLFVINQEKGNAKKWGKSYFKLAGSDPLGFTLNYNATSKKRGKHVPKFLEVNTQKESFVKSGKLRIRCYLGIDKYGRVQHLKSNEDFDAIKDTWSKDNASDQLPIMLVVDQSTPENFAIWSWTESLHKGLAKEECLSEALTKKGQHGLDQSEVLKLACFNQTQLRIKITVSNLKTIHFIDVMGTKLDNFETFKSLCQTEKSLMTAKLFFRPRCVWCKDSSWGVVWDVQIFKMYEEFSEINHPADETFENEQNKRMRIEL